ncbi:unnamed protein product [Coffea canephora]|uniref:non-specific serine/threonine protein kinase n=2 Tax=Coffea canephora TaxID=49390 RepID=A0A068UAV4_COFCA|nr:unnamed protein product [Coffea canephora]
MDKIYYFFLFIFSFARLDVTASGNSSVTADQSALLAIRERMMTSGSHQILAKNWSVTSSVCDWIGVTCGSRHRRVTSLDISNMNLAGTIPPLLGNLSFLVLLNISGNNFHGELPRELVQLFRLRYLDFANNNLGGELPSWFGLLHKLQFLSLENNRFTGPIPPSIANMSSLENLWLSNNSIEGTIPIEFQNLHNLKNLDRRNPFKNIIIVVTCIIQTHDSCTFAGAVPDEVWNLTLLSSLDFGDNKLTGGIPEKIGNLQRLELLNLGNNTLSGSMPAGIFNISSLQYIGLHRNKFSGTIPLTMSSKLSKLKFLYLCQNYLSGVIPNTISNASQLVYLLLHGNELTGSVPSSLGSLRNLQFLLLASNRLSSESSNPELSFFTFLTTCRFLRYLTVDQNPLNGFLPSSLSNYSTSLEVLHAANCQIKGNIPVGISNLSTLLKLDFSSNELIGSVPKTINRLSVPPCQSNSTRRSSKRKVLLLVISMLGTAAILTAVGVAILILRWLKKPKVSGGTKSMSLAKYGRFSYYDLLHSTDNYRDSNLVGKGSFGSVYKGILSDDTVVAIKVFNLQVEGSLKSFDKECNVLKSLRHRNLTKVLGSCSNPDFKALVLKYMPNGNLEEWLYLHNNFLDLTQRVNILIDVACALEYLHYGYDTPVVHCDLKPTNILLDEDMVAHVSDFSIAKMFREGESILYTDTLATLGYIAPEYGSEGIVSTRIDVYSFGIVSMETFSRMKPSDDMFLGDLSLKSWVENSLPDALQVIDENLIRPEDEHFTDKLNCVILIMKLAVNCCRESPGERMNMKDVLVELKKIKQQLLLTASA